MSEKATPGTGTAQPRTRTPERRGEPRLDARFSVATHSVDATRDPSGTRFHRLGEADRVVNISRRGLCLLSPQPPGLGTRMWLELDFGDGAVELIGRTCWTRVSFERGERAARPICSVGVEILGGSGRALDRFDQFVSSRARRSSVAAPESLV